MFSKLTFYFGVGVIYDGEEHVDKDEEDEKDKQHEENGSQITISCAEGIEIKTAEDDIEKSKTETTKTSVKYEYGHFFHLFGAWKGLCFHIPNLRNLCNT